MTSLLTNTAAMVALQTLNQINASLNTTNNRVSTGLRIAQAQDSAAYWAIATTTASDNGALSSVQDALAIGKSTLDVMYNGLESTRDSLQKMKELLVSARQPGVDRTNVQVEIDGLLTDMQNKAGASVINEQNFLAVDSSAADWNATKAIVASFERSASGISISTIDLDISSLTLTDAHATAASKIGILDQQRGVAVTTGPSPLAADATISVLDVDISALTDSEDDLQRLEQFISLVDSALVDTISAQNTVGVNLARAESQKSFIDALMDANDRAVGALIDANMEEESTKLRALQTQQQLSVESLSIANASAQNVLALFR
ncbi:flagellin [Acuticoccus sediminis]|uniref:Flagellin n=1 Tax=Acuticoccus sediminis TaxID=2184697 RepID=A0A8B2NYS5_9HYPH|nr:flagellin [Acuticoccus sediminis]RAI00958.1 flagellin [Acuticoccus sediminis]